MSWRRFSICWMEVAVGAAAVCPCCLLVTRVGAARPRRYGFDNTVSFLLLGNSNKCFFLMIMFLRARIYCNVAMRFTAWNSFHRVRKRERASSCGLRNETNWIFLKTRGNRYASRAERLFTDRLHPGWHKTEHLFSYSRPFRRNYSTTNVSFAEGAKSSLPVPAV